MTNLILNNTHKGEERVDIHTLKPTAMTVIRRGKFLRSTSFKEALNGENYVVDGLVLIQKLGL